MIGRELNAFHHARQTEVLGSDRWFRYGHGGPYPKLYDRYVRAALLSSRPINRLAERVNEDFMDFLFDGCKSA